MSSRLHLAPFLCAFLTTGFAQTGPAGHWEGTLQLPDREIQITVDLTQDAKGGWIGALSQVSQGVRDVPLADISVNDKSVKFRIVAGGANAPAFDCNLESASSLHCTLTTPGGSIAATMKRTGEAKVELPKSNPAVSAEFEGDWEGIIDAPSGPLRITIHLKNQADKTVKATLDSLDQNAMGLPLTEVVQKGPAIEFQLRLANGGYKGALNKEATQLAGEWSQGGGSIALTLKKSPAK